MYQAYHGLIQPGSRPVTKYKIVAASDAFVSYEKVWSHSGHSKVIREARDAAMHSWHETEAAAFDAVVARIELAISELQAKTHHAKEQLERASLLRHASASGKYKAAGR